VRETYFSSLRLTEMALGGLGIEPDQASRAIALFRAHDERILHETYAIAHNEAAMIQTTQEANQELLDLFESDQRTGG
jgi:hypothetical protein